MRRGLLACLLWPLSRLYGAVAALRRHFYTAGWLPRTALAVPVLVVGNVFVGGTGKTPFTIWLVELLRAAGYTPGVISRGHGAQDMGGKRSAPRTVDAGSRPQDRGDEPVLIAARTGVPVVVGRDRVAAGRALLADHPLVDVLISDDGLQHYAMDRALEIVLFDARGGGNGWLLPAGPLREPLSRHRDFTIVNAPRAVAGMPVDAFRMQLSGAMVERLAQRSHRMPLAVLAQTATDHGKPRIVAAAGIGNPARFFAMLAASGLEFTALPLPDHHDFLDQPFAGLDADIILITEKDAVKCVGIESLRQDPRVWVVPVTATLEAGLAEQILEKLRGYPIA
ncbi:MAG: tetraacyldisaccharide 4'-kinase [Janthinobacterium lividum]